MSIATRMVHPSPSTLTNRGFERLRQAFRLFWSAADDYAKYRLLLAVVLVGTGALLVSLTPVALKLAVDRLTAHGRSSSSAFGLILLYVLGQYLWRCSTELRTMLHGHAEQRLRRCIGLRVFDHLIRMPMRFIVSQKAGAMGETAEQGLRGAQMVLQHAVYTVLPVAVELLVISLVLVEAGHSLYLVILGGSAIAYALAFYRWAGVVSDSGEQVSSTHIAAHAQLTDVLINAEAVKYFDAERSMSQRYDAALRHAESAWRRFFSSYATNGIIVATIFATSLSASLVLAMRDVDRGAMTVGDFVLVNAYVVRLVQPLELLGFAVRDIAQGLSFLSTMLALFKEKTEADESARRMQHPERGELVFENVTFGYLDERAVLKNVSFTVPAGKTIAIVGASGSGKSSLIRLLFRLYEPDAGRILLDQFPISELPLSQVRRSIAVVSQDLVLFHDTIARNIGFGRFGASQNEIREAARLANLHDAIMSMPEEYETIVGERGLKLSGGERQRVAIARAALKKPLIAVFDEATSSLDSKTETEILRNLTALSGGCTTLVIAHRLATVVHADEILVLNRGVIVERGTHQELRALGGYYAGLWDAQQAGAAVGDELNESVAQG
jgi:ABC-type transport system involved in Fe-S cluster assembly fused permease/ATPase subunit